LLFLVICKNLDVLRMLCKSNIAVDRRMSLSCYEIILHNLYLQCHKDIKSFIKAIGMVYIF